MKAIWGSRRYRSAFIPTSLNRSSPAFTDESRGGTARPGLLLHPAAALSNQDFPCPNNQVNRWPFLVRPDPRRYCWLWPFPPSKGGLSGCGRFQSSTLITLADGVCTTARGRKWVTRSGSDPGALDPGRREEEPLDWES